MSFSGHSSRDSDSPTMGIIGGSGLCTFPELEVISRVRPDTPYGPPSDDIAICSYQGHRVAFLPRHGSTHHLPPHRVPYKANIAALKAVGVQHIIATCIVGSLKKEIPPGSFVLLDQFVNKTWGRDDTWDVDQSFIHLPMGEPYCEQVRDTILKSASEQDMAIIPKGTVVVIQGPRFSTIAESRSFSQQGWDVVNMTQYPECYFARELGLCYAAIAAVTDYDVGLQESLVMDPQKMDRILGIFRENGERIKQFLLRFIESRPALSCRCSAQILKAYYQQ